jgi:surfeit locus 1 family protein
LHRLAWKENIIAQIEARATAPAAALPEFGAWEGLRPEDYEYRHVLLRGTFENEKEVLVFRPSGSSTGLREPGYLVLTPMRLASGAYVIVNRGFTPASRSDAGARRQREIEGETALTGLMREPESRNFFTPADRPDAGQYFTRDPNVIASHFGLPRTAPFIIDADASPVPGGWPKGGATELVFPNNHLSYAMTWFGLAAALCGVFLAYAWQTLRTGAAK